MPPALRSLLRPLLLGFTLLPAGCILISRTVKVESKTFTAATPVVVKSPVRVHLADGTIAIFRQGATVKGDSLHGSATHWSIALDSTNNIMGIPLDSIVGAEVLSDQYNPVRTLLYSAALTSLGVLATAGAAVAIFGSCPTIYSEHGDTLALEAEAFSYSITPLLEARDVDRLIARPDANGILRLHVWNEALETHHINHLELLEASHAPNERVLPDERGRPIAVSEETVLGTVTDRLGRDLRKVLAEADGQVFSTAPTLMDAATAKDFEDHIDITVGRAGLTDSVAVLLRMRNSLLNTVLFYDFMLAKPGARSLDWLSRDLEQISATVELGKWYNSRLGMRIHVWDKDHWRQVTRIADYGPIAFRDGAIMVPAPGADSVRIRLSFLVDDWRIDRLAVAGRVRRPGTRTVPMEVVRGVDGSADTAAHAALARADERRLETRPGERFTVAFAVGADRPNSSRTFLVATHGYYTEWVRGKWMKGARDTASFSPNDNSLIDVVRSWQIQKDSLEKQFFLSRVPVK